MSLTVDLSMPAQDRAELTRWTRSPSLPAGLAQRARIELLANEGVGTNGIVHRVGVSKSTALTKATAAQRSSSRDLRGA